jgi:hypothetical protein
MVLTFTSHIPLETNININNVEFYGDLVEFNKFEVKETVLIDVTHSLIQIIGKLVLILVMFLL